MITVRTIKKRVLWLSEYVEASNIKMDDAIIYECDEGARAIPVAIVLTTMASMPEQAYTLVIDDMIKAESGGVELKQYLASAVKRIQTEREKRAIARAGGNYIRK